jgi:hypothetical protein
VLRYRGKNVTRDEVEFIKELIAAHPTLSRRRLSTKLCEAWNWVQANGQLRTMVCRGLMLALHRAGWIELPPVRRVTLNPLAQRRKPTPMLDLSWEPIQETVGELGPIEIRQVRRTPEEKLFGSLMEAHNMIVNHTKPVCRMIAYLFLRSKWRIRLFTRLFADYLLWALTPTRMAEITLLAVAFGRVEDFTTTIRLLLAMKLTMPKDLSPDEKGS